ncbi:hypothetical protein KKH3_35900 [Pectobacterium actinidiae]|nr:hypothetical protein KKH3_35900 [Pectobacterium actinidiae]
MFIADMAMHIFGNIFYHKSGALLCGAMWAKQSFVLLTA